MAIIGALLLFTACKRSGDGSATQTTGFKMRMTDSPGDYDRVNVEVIGAEVHSDVNGWTALNVKTGIYNLLDLTNGKDTLIADGQVAVGTVSQIRLILGTNNSVVYKGDTYPLETPSGQQSGLKLQVHAELQAGINYTMLLDFDADKSVVQTGNGKYILKPVIRVVSKAKDGAIKGVVLPLLSNPAVYAINGNDSFSTYANLLNGSFFIGGLAAADYKVVIMPKAPFKDTAILNVNVSLGAATDIGLITVQ
jgi:hypothetical protein